MKAKLNEIIFGTYTKAGRRFDLTLLILIVLSILVIMIESVPLWRAKIGHQLHIIEWVFTIIFTIEYLLRLYISPKPLKYFISFWGIIDLISILPTYLGLISFFSTYTSLRVARSFRLLRIFRVLRMNRFTAESHALISSLKASYYKIIVFLFFVTLVIIMAGTLMYVIEGGEHGFNSIPASIYWATVTVTTVGFGDITPYTDLGRFVATIMMILGYAIIAIPTSLITVEMSRINKEKRDGTTCKTCKNINPTNAIFCNQCAAELD